MSWKCPHCEDEIDYMQYTVPVSGEEYGTASLSDNERESGDRIRDHDYDNCDTSSDGSYVYNCPECSEEIDEGDLIWIAEDGDETPKKVIKVEKKEINEEETHEIIRPKQQIICNNNQTTNPTDSSIVCKECFHVMVTTTDRYNNYETNFIECPKCSTVNSPEEFKELLKNGYFKEKYHEHRKNTN